MNNAKAIQTPLGFVTGRDGFYLNDVQESKGGEILEFSGDINAELASEYKGASVWVKYKLKFTGVSSHKKEDVDQSGFDEESSFVELPAVEGRRVFIFATYDFIYEIAADSFTFELGEKGIS